MGPGRVALDVDGQPWRTVPDEVVLRCGLAVGVQLDRPSLRRLRAELKRAEAVERGLRALARRPLSERALDERLTQAGAGAAAREYAVARLRSAGLVDDQALARRRAQTLAARGWGDRAVAARLEDEGYGEETVRGALESLEPEIERARRVTASVLDRRKAWALLARRGFEPESAGAVLGGLDESG